MTEIILHVHVFIFMIAPSFKRTLKKNFKLLYCLHILGILSEKRNLMNALADVVKKHDCHCIRRTHYKTQFI